jgi:hypothetical protein
MGLLVLGVGVLVAAFSPTNASAVVPGMFLPAGTATTTYTCGGNDALDGGLSSQILAAVGLASFTLPTTITTNAVDSPNDGEAFSMDFTYAVTLPSGLVDVAVNTAMVTQLTQQGQNFTMNATGATPASAAITPPDQTINLPAVGDPITDIETLQGPFPTQFTRAGAVGTPIVFTPGPFTVSSVAGGTTLQILCNPASTSPMSLVDQQGETPSSTTQPAPPTLPPASPTTAGTGPGPTVQAGAEGASRLARTGFNEQLLLLGIAMIGAGCVTAVAGRRVAKSTARPPR